MYDLILEGIISFKYILFTSRNNLGHTDNPHLIDIIVPTNPRKKFLLPIWQQFVTKLTNTMLVCKR